MVVYVGAMSAWHGAEDLIEIATKFERDLRFLMVGKGLDMIEEKTAGEDQPDIELNGA